MLPRTPSARAALAGLALALALALVILGTWWLAQTPRTRGDRARTGAEPASAERPGAKHAESALQPAESPARSVLPAAPPPSQVESGARLLVRLARADAPLIGEATVTLLQDGGRSATEFRGVASGPALEIPCAPGDVKLMARGSGPPRLVSLPVSLTLRAGASESVVLLLAPEVILSGTIEDESGRMLDRIDVHLRRQKTLVASAASSAAGRFLLPPVPTGEYELVLGDPLGPLRPPETLQLAPGAAPLELVLPVLLPLELRVIDGSGRPVPAVRVEGSGQPGGRLQGITDVDGRLRAVGLPPGEYRVFARHDSLGRATRALVLDARTSADVQELVLRR